MNSSGLIPLSLWNKSPLATWALSRHAMHALAVFQEIFHRYTEKAYPATSTLVPLYFPEEPLNLKDNLAPPTELPPDHSTVPPSSPPQEPKKPSTTLVIPPVSQQPKETSHTWACVPIYPGLSHEELLKENYPALKPYVQRPARASCGIFVHETQEHDILFLIDWLKFSLKNFSLPVLFFFIRQLCLILANSPILFVWLPYPESGINTHKSNTTILFCKIK